MRRKQFKNILCSILACVMLGGVVLALETGESLISKKHFETDYAQDILEQGRGKADKVIDGVLDDAVTRLDEITAEMQDGLVTVGGGLVSDALITQDYGQGDKITLGQGSTVLATIGTVRIDHDGVVIDVTEGIEMPSGSHLQEGHRYIVGEETNGQLEILSGYATVAYQGSYAFHAGSGKNHPFLDVTSDDSYNDAVSFVYNNNLFAGMGDGTFGAVAPMNRAMVMTVFYHLAGDPADDMAAATMTFDDVSADSWFAPYVSWGATEGVTAGTGKGEFSPKMEVNQEQMVQLLYNFASKYMGLTLVGDSDLSAVQGAGEIHEWAETAMRWAVAQGIVESPLVPRESVTRAEVAIMLMNFSLVYLQ